MGLNGRIQRLELTLWSRPPARCAACARQHAPSPPTMAFWRAAFGIAGSAADYCRCGCCAALWPEVA
jgi:hypothetical protein